MEKLTEELETEKSEKNEKTKIRKGHESRGKLLFKLYPATFFFH